MTVSLPRISWACAVVVVLATTLSSSAAQSGAGQSVAQARTAAERALLAGRYDDVAKFADAHERDATLVVLRARALMARGESGAAEKVLTPAAAANPAGDAALELGLLQLSLGRRSEGRRAMQLLLMAEVRSATAPDYARAGRAARALGQFNEANGFFREAVTLSPNDPQLETHWGELFVEKHQWGEAAKSFQAALKNQPDYGPAQLGMAEAVVNENPPAAERFARRALELNPADVRAHLFLAELATFDDQKDEAREAIDAALAINPNSPEALALSAALHYVEGRDAEYKEAINAALTINPLYGEAFRVVGEITARYYRFDEAAEQARRAIAIDRENPRTQADLGLYLMRTGDERNARRALETSFRVDPYDVITYNLLEVLDLLDTFEVIADDEVVVKLHPDESGVMREYVPALAKEALRALGKRWNFTPQGPILVEVFPVHDHFAVRTVGLEGMIGALGACFGRVVTMDSPKARPPGDFSWEATLWHEIAHVITLQLSNQRIPRWLSEGISEYEETRARPEWFRNMTVPFVRAMEAGEVIKLQDLNSGFQDPSKISLAYYQASVLVEHIVEQFGQDALRAFVASFADGIDTETAITRVFKTDIDTLQASFDNYIAARYGALQRALAVPDGFEPEQPLEKLRAAAAQYPDNYTVHVVLGRALRGEDPEAAMAAFERAITLAPMITGAESAYMQVMEIAMARGDKARAAEVLEAMLAYEHTAIDAARQVVTLLDGTSDQPRIRRALKRVVAIDPFDAPSHTSLGRMALGAGETAEAVKNFRVALAAGPINRASAHADLAEGLLAAGNRAEAKREALAALEIAPTYERAQDLLLKLSDGPGSR
jgi:tetratricopeptide (TPR) repeat protein